MLLLHSLTKSKKLGRGSAGVCASAWRAKAAADKVESRFDPLAAHPVTLGDLVRMFMQHDKAGSKAA